VDEGILDEVFMRSIRSSLLPKSTALVPKGIQYSEVGFVLGMAACVQNFVWCIRDLRRTLNVLTLNMYIRSSLIFWGYCVCIVLSS
jgi:hypothetical protein